MKAEWLFYPSFLNLPPKGSSGPEVTLLFVCCVNHSLLLLFLLVLELKYYYNLMHFWEMVYQTISSFWVKRNINVIRREVNLFLFEKSYMVHLIISIFITGCLGQLTHTSTNSEVVKLTIYRQNPLWRPQGLKCLVAVEFGHLFVGRKFGKNVIPNNNLTDNTAITE